MKKLTIVLSVLLLALAIVGAVYFEKNGSALKSENEVKALIETCYINGAFNDLNPEAMKKGFHKEFAIFSAKGEELSRYPIEKWVSGVSKRKSDPEFDPASNQWEHNFASVDVTGNSAAAKVELFKDGEHVYTDYLSLLKFDSGWKIVAKVYHQHE